MDIKVTELKMILNGLSIEPPLGFENISARDF
jgi:hypothetical protein